jgi:hypothetical protein
MQDQGRFARPLLQRIVYFRLAAGTPPALGYRLLPPLTPPLSRHAHTGPAGSTAACQLSSAGKRLRATEVDKSIIVGVAVEVLTCAQHWFGSRW